MQVTIELTPDAAKAIEPLREAFGYSVEEVCEHAVAHYCKNVLPCRLKDVERTTAVCHAPAASPTRRLHRLAGFFLGAR